MEPRKSRAAAGRVICRLLALLACGWVARGGASAEAPRASGGPLSPLGLLDRVELRGEEGWTEGRGREDTRSARVRSPPLDRGAGAPSPPAAPRTEFRTPSDIAVPHITLRTNDGLLFGGSLAAAGDILMLGWADRVLASPDGDQGGLFYLTVDEMWGTSVDNGAQVVDVRTSEVRASAAGSLRALPLCAPCLQAACTRRLREARLCGAGVTWGRLRLSAGDGMLQVPERGGVHSAESRRCPRGRSDGCRRLPVARRPRAEFSPAA